MYYELYVDVLFLVNFLLDYLLLQLVKRMLKCSATHGRICLAAALGAGSTCLILIVPMPHVLCKFILFHVVVNTCMIRVGLKIKGLKAIVKARALLYIGGILLGGLLSAMQPYVRTGSLFFAVAIGGYYIVSKIWDFLSALRQIHTYTCKVRLYIGEKNCQVQGIIDTGNGLCDPYTGKPVHVLDALSAKHFFAEEKLRNIHYVPYHSIGKQEGVLLTVQIDSMCICGEEETWIEKPLIGISETVISATGEYQMILNPNFN